MEHDHLDADVIAGWAEGSLDPNARAAAEAHAADCTRCQAVLAAMIRTEPATAGPVGGWIGAHARWLVPLVTAAAALAIWVALSRDVLAPGPSPISTAAPSEESTAARRPAPLAAPQAPTIAPEPPRDLAKRGMQPETGTAHDTAAAARPERPEQKPAATRREQPSAVAETVAIDASRRDALMGRVPPPATGPPVAQPNAAAPPPVPVETPPPRAEAKPEAVGQFRAAARVTSESPLVATQREFASPDISVRWRIGPGASIQRSTDAGKTWVVLTSGVTAPLVAASAPSNDVCWIVGRSGVVVLTTDGATWRRVAFPESVDLRAVTATDAKTATVTTVDGRVFRTADGGLTWQR